MHALLLKMAYQLRHHCLGDWALDRWVLTLALIVAAIIPLRWLVFDRPQMLQDWILLLLLIGAAVGVSCLRYWAQRRLYVAFEPQVKPPPAPRRLDPTDKVAVRPTGQFEVEGKSAIFADLLAYWRTFASREHTIMAIVHRSRFLLLGHTAAHELGMWYVFFTPETIEGITPGALAFGRSQRLGLRVAYRCKPLLADARKPPGPVTRILYIGFDDEAGRQAVWADLLAD
jgi:hypothetical protein